MCYLQECGKLRVQNHLCIHMGKAAYFLAFARGDVVFIFSFNFFTFSKETGRYLIYSLLLYVFDQKIVNQ